MTKLLLVDCDGTIRESASGNKFIQYPKDQQIIDGAGSALAYYQNQGWTIVGISNQGGVQAGHKSVKDCLEEQQYTLELCPQIAAIIFCPDYEGETIVDIVRPMALAFNPDFDHKQTHEQLKGTYRKPNPGMLLLAMAWLGVDKADCLYVGDMQDDQSAAAAAGINFRWASYWRNPFLF